MKRFWRSLIHTLVYFQLLKVRYLHGLNIYQFCQGWERKPSEEE